MNTISQKQAVINEVQAILGSSFDPSLPVKDQLTKDQISTIKENVAQGISNGTVAFSKSNTPYADIKKYVSGMVSNHFRKAPELNGNNKYSPTSTGRGSRDPQIVALNKLLGTLTEGSEDYHQVLSEIASRKTVVTAEKAELAKTARAQKELANIDVDALPEGFKDLANDLVNPIN
jgi:predicted transcriptional regulator